MFRKRMIIGVLRCLLIPVPLAASLASEQQGFEDVAGSWSGSGSMKPSDGPRERVKCKVDYDVKNAGHSLKLNCAARVRATK
jgi:hypothetical protein